MQSNLTHPSPNELSAFSLGQLDSDQSEIVEHHITECPPCCETLLEISNSDTFVALLRESERANESSASMTGQFEYSVEASDPIPEALLAHPRYDIVETIGRGGMGVVYKAQHRMMDRAVALKVINQGLVQKQPAVDRFQREVRAAAKLDHPNIVTAYDAERAGNHHFLVMEYIDGIDLSQLVKEHGPLPVDQACEFVCQAAMGLQHAHEQQMVHRDIKPHNLVVTKPVGANDASWAQSNVKILDFGLATLAAGESPQPAGETADGELTMAGTVMGTPDFISPEQARDAGAADIRSDIYSLGATFYFLLTGKPPFGEAPAMVKLKLHATEQPDSVSNLRQNVPTQVVAILERMMAKDPMARYQTPREVAEALSEFGMPGRGEGTHATLTPTTVTPTKATVLLWPTMIAGGLGLVVALLSLINPGLLGLATGGSSSQTSSQESSEQTTRRTENSQDSDSHATNNGAGAAAAELAANGSGESDNSIGTDEVRVVAGPGGGTPAEGAGGAPERTRLSALTDLHNLPSESWYYFAVNLSDLEFLAPFEKGLEEKHRDILAERWRNYDWIWSYAVLDGDGDAFISPPRTRARRNEAVKIAIRVPESQEVRGRLLLPDTNADQMIELPFRIAASQLKKGDKRTFFRVKADHYEFLRDRRLPGSAWFGHQVRLAARELGEETTSEVETTSTVNSRSNSLNQTFDIMSGGIAISENLRLDEVIKESGSSTRKIAIETVKGVDIPEFDWTPLVQGKDPKIDALARLIPSDQHVFFFESFAGLLNALDHANNDGLAMLSLARVESERSKVLERYQRQLGLTLDEMARMFGPQLVQSLAVTGSDPYFETGTDIALILEPKNRDVLSQLIQAQITLAANRHPGVIESSGEVGGVAYTCFQSPGREISSYQAIIGNSVVVANSLVQIERIANCRSGSQANLTSTPEYKFFRDRYPLSSEQGLHGLLVLSDQTIRRWCSPQWRIGASRRLLARASLAAARAHQIEQSSMRGGESDPAELQRYKKLVGEVMIDGDGVVRSEEYGTLSFLTPISELDLSMITEAESKSYRSWRTRYERAWRRTFDPIAIHFRALPDDLSADVTVMPLITNSSYDLFFSLVQGVEINPLATDPHPESIVHTSFSINKNSTLVNLIKPSLAPELPKPLQIDPLAWFGSTITIYADEDPYWDKAPVRGFNLFDPENGAPLALRLEVADSRYLIPFLTALKSHIESIAPGMTIWESQKYGDQAYVKIRSGDGAGALVGQEDERFELYYAITHNALVFSPRESMIHSAIDRALASASEPGADKAPIAKPTDEQTLGDNMTLELDGRFVKAIQAMLYSHEKRQLQFEAWKNLPALNEWRRNFPDEDPVMVHEELWHREPFSTSGGDYRWNSKYQSMESDIYGPPGTPIPEDFMVPVPYRNVESAGFGVTFEHGGLRARMHMTLDDEK